MNIFIARQPIFNRHKKLFGYELLYRSSEDNQFSADTDGELATTKVLANTLLSIGLDKIAGPRWVLINFTKQHLLDGTPASLPPGKIIVEILEDVPATPEVIAACNQLKEREYILALDDFVFDENLEPLVAIANIIKVDFQEVTLETIENKITPLKDRGIRLLAEKIETYQEYDAARKMGFSYFQGYFFTRPEMLKNKEIPSSKINLLQLLTEVNKKNFDIQKIEKMIVPDVAITYKLLRYINSVYYYLLKEVTSLHHALIYLGTAGVRQFVSLVATSELASDKPDELMRSCIVRARICEQLGKLSGKHDTSQLFLLGLFSLLDAMLDVTMHDIVDQLPLPSEISAALVDKKGPLYPYLATIIAYEQGDWQECSTLLQDLGINAKTMLDTYLEGVNWADQLSKGKAG